MIRLAAALLIVTPMMIGAAAAQEMPRLNFEPSCKASASGALGLTEDMDSCRRSETTARDQAAKQWSSFASADRASCTRLVTMSGHDGTYTELLTCLEMKRDARKLPDDSTLSTVGQSTR
jgi:hypothetical protein